MQKFYGGRGVMTEAEWQRGRSIGGWGVEGEVAGGGCYGVGVVEGWYLRGLVKGDWWGGGGGVVEGVCLG